MIRCSEAQAALIELVFGDLDSVQEMRVNQHLLECATCREEEARLLKFTDSARRAPLVAPPALRARVEASLVGARPAPGLARPVPAYVAIAAALLGALAAALLPLRLPLLRPPQAGAKRASVVPTGRESRFTVAGSYDTRVRAASWTAE